jgi:hypothetical protein
MTRRTTSHYPDARAYTVRARARGLSSATCMLSLYINALCTDSIRTILCISSVNARIARTYDSESSVRLRRCVRARMRDFKYTLS